MRLYHGLRGRRKQKRGNIKRLPAEDRPWLPIPEPPRRPPKEESADRDRGVVIIPVWDPEAPAGS
jgi:hypothetical protein